MINSAAEQLSYFCCGDFPDMQPRPGPHMSSQTVRSAEEVSEIITGSLTSPPQTQVLIILSENLILDWNKMEFF